MDTRHAFFLDLESTERLQEERLNDRIFYIEHYFERQYDRLPTKEEIDKIIAEEDEEGNLPETDRYSYINAAVFAETPNAHSYDQIIVQGDGSREDPYCLKTGSGVNVRSAGIIWDILSQYSTVGPREYWVYISGGIRKINLDEA